MSATPAPAGRRWSPMRCPTLMEFPISAPSPSPREVAPEVRITSLNVYDGERVSRGGVLHAVEWARDHADQLDAVVLAFPPAEVLDPVGAGLASGAWAELSDAAKPASGRLHGLAEGWQRLRERLAELAAGGVTVVVPAGDLGPAPQSLLGVAGLPEVLTVGAFDGNGVAPASASVGHRRRGPAPDGRGERRRRRPGRPHRRRRAPARGPRLAPGGRGSAGGSHRRTGRKASAGRGGPAPDRLQLLHPRPPRRGPDVRPPPPSAPRRRSARRPAPRPARRPPPRARPRRTRSGSSGRPPGRPA